MIISARMSIIKKLGKNWSSTTQLIILSFLSRPQEIDKLVKCEHEQPFIDSKTKWKTPNFKLGSGPYGILKKEWSLCLLTCPLYTVTFTPLPRSSST